MTWKLEPIRLVELIAGLHELKAFGPEVNRSQLYKFFSEKFNFNIKGPEQAIVQIKQRKIEPAVFCLEMRDAIISFIDRSVENKKNHH